MEDYDQEDDKYCLYCYQDMENDALEDHIMYVCPTVVKCEYCVAFIYLKELTYHLLHECEHATLLECPKCHLAFEAT